MGGTSSGSVDVEDPRDTLKQKQREALSRNATKRTRGTTRSSSFLGTPESVDNISQSVTPESSTMLASVGTYNSDFEGGQDGSRKVNLSALVNPSKKDINVSQRRKSKNTIFIVEKPVSGSRSSVNMLGGKKSRMNIQNEVNEEKLIMQMQSASSLKYT